MKKILLSIMCFFALFINWAAANGAQPPSQSEDKIPIYIDRLPAGYSVTIGSVKLTGSLISGLTKVPVETSCKHPDAIFIGYAIRGKENDIKITISVPSGDGTSSSKETTLQAFLSGNNCFGVRINPALLEDKFSLCLSIIACNFTGPDGVPWSGEIYYFTWSIPSQYLVKFGDR